MASSAADAAPTQKDKSAALKFVLMIGAVSFFADMTYEGSRSITGPFLAVLGASATAVGLIAGFGELLGYTLRIASGRLSDRTGRYWPITLFGYFIQMLAVPALALAPSWGLAAVLIIVERVGKAMRNPPRDVMLAHASTAIGRGWGFGVHEALDQSGALVGPLIAAAVLYRRGELRSAFALLLVPALLTLCLIVVARLVYPTPHGLEAHPPDVHRRGLPRIYWLYLAGAALVAAGFADFSLCAFHFEKAGTVPKTWVPIFYSVAMAVSGAGSLVFGRLFDRVGLKVLVPLTIVAAAFAPLVFLGGFGLALVGVALWGLGMGVHESIMAAAVAEMAPAARLASAYGVFTTGYGVSWFVGSAILGILYDVSMPALIAFAVGVELAAVPFFVVVARRMRPTVA
jgi:MFS family permease